MPLPTGLVLNLLWKCSKMGGRAWATSAGDCAASSACSGRYLRKLLAFADTSIAFLSPVSADAGINDNRCEAGFADPLSLRSNTVRSITLYSISLMYLPLGSSGIPLYYTELTYLYCVLLVYCLMLELSSFQRTFVRQQ